jgi:hypothetical protein
MICSAAAHSACARGLPSLAQAAYRVCARCRLTSGGIAVVAWIVLIWPAIQGPTRQGSARCHFCSPAFQTQYAAIYGRCSTCSSIALLRATSCNLAMRCAIHRLLDLDSRALRSRLRNSILFKAALRSSRDPTNEVIMRPPWLVLRVHHPIAACRRLRTSPIGAGRTQSRAQQPACHIGSLLQHRAGATNAWGPSAVLFPALRIDLPRHPPTRARPGSSYARECSQTARP